MPSTDPEQALEHETDNLEHDLDRLQDNLDEAKGLAAERAKEASGEDSDETDEQTT